MDLTNSSEPKKEIFDVAGATRSSTSTISSTSKRKRRNKQRDHRPTSHPDDRSSALEKRLNGKPAHDPLRESVAKETKPLSGRPGNGARGRIDEGPEQAEARLAKMCAAVRTLIECVGEDPDREGLLTTPSRYAKALLFLTKGYQINVDDILNNALFHEGYSEMVIVKDIDIYSLCEHHLVPFIGKMQIGYMPSDVVIGLSKLPRIAEMFSRRLQIQERLTKEVAQAIVEAIKPQGVIVTVESSHLCMVMRGVEKTSATSITSCVLGCFETRAELRAEFMGLLGVNSTRP